LIRDLGVAQELLAGVKEGIERETQLVTAAKTYERAATTDDGMSALWARAGHCWLLASRYQEAIESYRKTPEELLDWIQKSDLAAALLLSGQTESALASIATILNQDLAPWQALFNAAIVLHLSGHSETAARALEDARARAGKSGWRVELLLGMVYRTLGDSDREENAFRQAMYQRGVLDAQICQAFGRAFQANTESRLRRRISEFRRDFRRFHAKTDAVDRLEADLGAAVEAYFNWLAQFVEAGGRSSGLLAEALQQSFELLNSLNKKLTRLEEIKRGKDRWPADFFIESVSTTASGRDPLKANNREAVMPPADAVLTMDWQAMQSRASSKLQVLPIQTSLVLQDPILLEGLGQIQSTAADTYAHRLSIIARIFEVQTSAMLRCYDSLSNRSGKVTVLHKAYQERTIQRVFSRMQGRAILADDVGLGKTVEAGLCLIEYRLRRLVRRCLILVPTIDLARQWQHELEDKLGHHPPFSWTVGRSNPGKRQDIMSVDTWIATYQVAIRHQADYLRVEWDMVIADEAHHLANRSSETYKFVKQLRSPHLLLLTATPIQHSVNDLFSLITIIRPGLFSSLRAYRTFFSDDALADQAQRGAVARLLSQVMIRNTLLAVADQAFTGRRVFKNIPVKLGKSELSFYENVTNMVLALGKAVRRGRLPMEYYSIAKMASSSARATFVAIDRMAREANRSNREVRLIRDWYEELAPLLADIVTPAKALVVKNILREISSRKALIFVEFRETALQLEEKLGIPAIHGKISQAKREAIIKDFENNNSVRALVATRGFAEGLNLAFCSVLINYDLPWNPMRIEQRIGRIQRIGQHHPEVLIYSLAASGTIEEEIRDALMRKVDLFQRVLGEIGLDLASITDGRIITARLRAILKEASNLADLRDRVRRFFEEVMPPVVSEDSL
jgi:superfamily II DNA or RNA helicase